MPVQVSRTTVRLDPALVAQAKAEALRRDTTLTSLIEEGLLTVLAGPVAVRGRRKIELPVAKELGGTLPGVDLNNAAVLSDLMDGIG